MSEATPLERAPAALAGRHELWLKREDLHDTGSFKWRGALPTLREYREAGAEAVVTASTGNHGAASAWAAQRAGLTAIVFAPEGASPPKLAMLEELGAELHLGGRDVDEAKERARELASERRLPFFEDGAEAAQFAGYEAIGREIEQQLGTPAGRVLVAVGNGALLIGVARVLPGAAVGVVAKAAPVMALSVAAGKALECDSSATFADGMAVRVAVPIAIRELVELAVPMVEVSERAIARAVGAFAAAGLRVEGSPGAALAALELVEPAEPTVIIVCGRNIDDELHERAVERPDSFDD